MFRFLHWLCVRTTFCRVFGPTDTLNLHLLHFIKKVIIFLSLTIELYNNVAMKLTLRISALNLQIIYLTKEASSGHCAGRLHNLVTIQLTWFLNRFHCFQKKDGSLPKIYARKWCPPISHFKCWTGENNFDPWFKMVKPLESGS